MGSCGTRTQHKTALQPKETNHRYGNNIMNPHNHTVKSGRKQDLRVHTAWFHLYKVQELAQLSVMRNISMIVAFGRATG